MKLLSSEILVWFFVLGNKHFVSFLLLFSFIKFGEEDRMSPLTEPAPPPFLGTLLRRASLSLLARL